MLASSGIVLRDYFVFYQIYVYISWYNVTSLKNSNVVYVVIFK